MNKLDHLIKSIDRLVELNEEMLREVRGGSTKVLTDPIDSLKARKLLDISRTTLYRKTVDGTLPSVRIGGRTYYSESQIFKIRDHYLK